MQTRRRGNGVVPHRKRRCRPLQQAVEGEAKMTQHYHTVAAVWLAGQLLDRNVSMVSRRDGINFTTLKKNEIPFIQLVRSAVD